MTKIDFYATRQYDVRGKREETWRLKIGEYSTGKGILVTTKELEKYEKKFKVKRIYNRR